MVRRRDQGLPLPTYQPRSDTLPWHARAATSTSSVTDASSTFHFFLGTALVKHNCCHYILVTLHASVVSYVRAFVSVYLRYPAGFSGTRPHLCQWYY